MVVATVGRSAATGGGQLSEGVEMSDYDECRDCGAMVASMTKHRRWHQRVDEIEATASSAEDTADTVSNILYQRGID